LSSEIACTVHFSAAQRTAKQGKHAEDLLLCDFTEQHGKVEQGLIYRLLRYALQMKNYLHTDWSSLCLDAGTKTYILSLALQFAYWCSALYLALTRGVGSMGPHMRGVQLSDVFEHIRYRAVMELALQDFCRLRSYAPFLLLICSSQWCTVCSRGQLDAAPEAMGLWPSMMCVMNADKSCCTTNKTITSSTEAAHQV